MMLNLINFCTILRVPSLLRCLGVSMLDGFLNIAHVKVYSPPSVANNMFSAPLPLRACICRHIYHQEVSPWGAFHKVRVLINPCQLGSIRYIKLHRAANTILSVLSSLLFWPWRQIKMTRHGEEFSKFREMFRFLAWLLQ